MFINILNWEVPHSGRAEEKPVVLTDILIQIFNLVKSLITVNRLLARQTQFEHLIVVVIKIRDRNEQDKQKQCRHEQIRPGFKFYDSIHISETVINKSLWATHDSEGYH